MSKAVTIKTSTIKTSWLGGAVKSVMKSIAPGQGELLRLFGTTDLYCKQARRMDCLAHQSLKMDVLKVSELPLAPPLPSVAALPPVSVVPMPTRQTQKPAEKPGLVPAPVPVAAVGEVQQANQNQAAAKAEDVCSLVALLNDKGQKVAEVKELPSGAMKITLDEYLFGGNHREPELVKIRR